jgi:hypothetical protein
MKIKKLIISLLLAFTSVCSTVDIAPLSPYINRGLSVDLHLSHNPLTITHYYEQKPQEHMYGYYSGYSAYSNVIYFKKNAWEREGFINVGLRNEKLEISAWLQAGFVRRSIMRTRIKFNHIDIGDNRIFGNIAVSSFVGFSFIEYISPFAIVKRIDSHVENIVLYGGASVGTRKKIDDFSYFEIFTNPHISFTQYTGLGSRSYDPAKVLENSYIVDKDKTFNLWFPDFSMPVGVGVKYRNFFARTGFAISVTIGGESRNLNRPGTFLDKVVVDSYNLPKIPIFMECGVHFRKFKQLEREMP